VRPVARPGHAVQCEAVRLSIALVGTPREGAKKNAREGKESAIQGFPFRDTGPIYRFMETRNTGTQPMRDTLLEVEIERFESYRRNKDVEVVQRLRVDSWGARVMTSVYCFETDRAWTPTCRTASRKDIRQAAYRLNSLMRA